MNRWTGPPLVQEQPVNLGQAKGMTLTGLYYPSIRLRFSDLSLRAGAMAVPFEPTSINYAEFCLRDCWWRGASFSSSPSSNSTVVVAITNTVFERASLSFTHYNSSQNTPYTVLLFNNLLRHGEVWFTYYLGTQNPVWKVQDNLWDGMTQTTSGDGIGGYFTVSHNGFTSGTSNGLGGSSNKTNLTRDFQAGPLGAYYYPTTGGGLTNLINAGSRNATNATLFHYTATVDRAKETNSVVDIGFHYVATDATGQPLDQDGDGLPDYLEDRNGNGSADAGETDWQTSNSGISGPAGLQVFTPLR